MEERIAELETKVEKILKGMTILQKYMDAVNDIDEIDETLFQNLNERVTDLENHTHDIMETFTYGGKDFEVSKPRPRYDS